MWAPEKMWNQQEGSLGRVPKEESLTRPASLCGSAWGVRAGHYPVPSFPFAVGWGRASAGKGGRWDCWLARFPSPGQAPALRPRQHQERAGSGTVAKYSPDQLTLAFFFLGFQFHLGDTAHDLLRSDPVAGKGQGITGYFLRHCRRPGPLVRVAGQRKQPGWHADGAAVHGSP